ncbi:MAG: hypothetical protein M1830_007452, partial [Pleopsidium flavum]
SSKALSSSVAKRLFPLLTSLPTTRVTSSPSSTRATRKTVPTWRISGLGTSPLKSKGRATTGRMGRSSS